MTIDKNNLSGEYHADVAALLAELERLEAQIRLAGVAAEVTVHQEVGRAITRELALAQERDQLKAENEALRKDAERYRWTAIDGNWLARVFGKWRAHTGEYGEANPTAWYPSRGEAIDAAISHAKAMAKEAGRG